MPENIRARGGLRPGPLVVATLTPVLALLPCLPVWLIERPEDANFYLALTCSLLSVVLIFVGFLVAARLADWEPLRVALALGGAVVFWLGLNLVSWLVGTGPGELGFAALLLALPGAVVFLVAAAKFSRRKSGRK